MTLLEQGYAVQKFFPAESAGGVGCLKALAQPLAGITFCPTGRIPRASAGRYLALPNVICVGGSWVAPADKVGAGAWADTAALSRDEATRSVDRRVGRARCLRGCSCKYPIPKKEKKT